MTSRTEIKFKKVIHVITRLDRGGSAQNTLQTCIGLAKRYQMILVHGASEESHMTEIEKNAVEMEIQKATSAGVQFICLGDLVRKISPWKDSLTLYRLWILFHKEKPDIVHTHTSKAGFLGRLAARAAKVPRIVHTPHGHVFYGHFGKTASALFRMIEKMMAPITDRIVALTEGERNDYIRYGVGRKNQLVTIHSGVDIRQFMRSESDDSFEKKNSLGLDPDSPVVGTVGWLLPIKGPDILLNAMTMVWKTFPNAQLVYVGKGAMLESIIETAVQRGAANRVFFLGWRDDVSEIYPVMDIFVLPSLNEGMGRVIVEAMSAGKPVVASRVGGIPDMIKNEVTGVLVPPNRPDDLAKAIRFLLANPAIARSMGEKAKMECHAFSLDNMLKKLDTIYIGLIGNDSI